MYIRSTLVTLLFVLMRSYTSTLHNNKQYTVYKTQAGCIHEYVLDQICIYNIQYSGGFRGANGPGYD